MAEAAGTELAGGTQVRAKLPRIRLAYSLGALFCVLTAACLYQAYRTNQQILKYYTPAPAVDYDPQVVPYEFTDADFVNPLDPRSASVQLQERIETISERIAELRTRGEANRAAQMQSRLDEILAHREGRYPEDGTVQLHAIGIYDGGEPKDRTNQIAGHAVGDAYVRITYTGGPLIVALCACDPVRWVLDVKPGVQLQKVILAGYYKQQVVGLPEGIPIEGNISGARAKYGFYAYTPLEAIVAAERLKELTGLDATTFFTTHEYEGEPFVIGPGGAEWTATMTLRSLEPLYQDAVRESRTRLAKELVAHSFPEIACSVSNPLGGYDASFAMNSIFGPYAQTMQPMNLASAQCAIDPRGPSVFSYKRNEGIVAFDPHEGSLTPWPVGLNIPPHVESCLAFDTKRKRLLVWGDGLAAIDILKKQATLLRQGNPSIAALTYSPLDDLLYACCAPYSGDSSSGMLSDLRTFNYRGAELSRTPLAVPIGGLSAPFPSGNLKLTMVGDKLLITHLGSFDGNHRLISSDTNYVVDPRTGKLLFACRRQPR